MFSVPSFNGFDEAAFMAFDERKWSSNLFNIERMRVGEMLGLVGDAIEKALAGSDVSFGRMITPHTPSVFNGRKVGEMAVCFSRTEEQKKAIAPVLDRKVALPDQISDAGEYHRHGFLGMVIRRDRIEVGMMIHSRAWLDVMNVLNRCKERDEESAKLVRMIRLLNPGAVVRIAPGREVPAVSFEQSMLTVLEEAVLNESFTFFVGWSFPAGDPVVADRGFAQKAAGLVAGLLDVWKFCAWKPTSNFLVSAAPAHGSGQPQTVVANDGSVMEFSLGSTVRLTGGIFAGRTGIVQDMDAKGNVKVLVGRVTVRTDAHSVHAA